MKRNVKAWLAVTVVFVTNAIPALGTEPVARSHHLDWDHWLWMARIAHRDPTYVPKDFDPTDHRIRLWEFRSAVEAYSRCGVTLTDGEAFIYSAETTQMISRLAPRNFTQLQRVHKTMAAWKAGRVREWFLEWEPR